MGSEGVCYSRQFIFQASVVMLCAGKKFRANMWGHMTGSPLFDLHSANVLIVMGAHALRSL
jgi:hypothetical protein